MVFLARELLRDPYFPLHAALRLDGAIRIAPPIQTRLRAVKSSKVTVEWTSMPLPRPIRADMRLKTSPKHQAIGSRSLCQLFLETFQLRVFLQQLGNDFVNKVELLGRELERSR